MKKKLYIIPVLFLFLIACDKLDINKNPVQPVDASSNLRLPGILSNMAYHIYANARYSSFHSLYLASRTGTLPEEDKWDYNQITRLGAWRWHYFDVGSNCMGLIKKAGEESSYNYRGVAKIMLAFSFLTATDVFGDMPIKEAYSGDFSPKYDTQDVVYTEIGKLLDEGLADLQKNSSEGVVMNGASDLLYQGDLAKWASFAHAVKARMYLHSANFDNGYDRVLDEVNAALTNWKDAIFFYSAAPQREWEKNMWGPSVPRPEWYFADITNELNATVHTDFFMNYMIVNEPGMQYDPRLYKLTTPGKNNKYESAKISEGLGGKSQDDFAVLYNGYWTSDNSPTPYILKEELLFIKAEAAFYRSNKDAAYQAYRDGIRANLERLQVSTDNITAYMASLKVKQTSADLTISDIMMQKYIALYLQPETWVDLRRYQYSANAYPGIYYPKNVLLDLGGKWIQRFPYDPQTEYIYNPQEIARLGASARNWVTTKFWWEANSTLSN